MIITASVLVVAFTALFFSLAQEVGSGRERVDVEIVGREIVGDPADTAVREDTAGNISVIGAGRGKCGEYQTGHWQHDTNPPGAGAIWVGDNCSYVQWNLRALQLCLNGTNLGLLGDSHTRELFRSLADRLGAIPVVNIDTNIHADNNFEFSLPNQHLRFKVTEIWCPQVNAFPQTRARALNGSYANWFPDHAIWGGYIKNNWSRIDCVQLAISKGVTHLVTNVPQIQNDNMHAEYDIPNDYLGYWEGPERLFKGKWVGYNALPLGLEMSQGWQAALLRHNASVVDLRGAFKQARSADDGWLLGHRQAHINPKLGMHIGSGPLDAAVWNQVITALAPSMCPQILENLAYVHGAV